VGRSLFISSFRKLPRGVTWLLVYFFILEIGVRFLWDPRIIGEQWYRICPSYDYGYDYTKPLFYGRGGNLTCYPTQYCELYRQSLPGNKTAREFRIFVFGSSVARGTPSCNFPLMVGEELHRGFPRIYWHVNNFSVPGYGSTRMALLLKKAIRYGPDVIIIAVHGSNEYEDERDLAYAKAVNAGFNRILCASHCIVLTKKIFPSLFPSENTLPSTGEDEPAASRKSENLKRWGSSINKNLDDMIAAARARHIPVVLMGRAMRDYGKDPFESARTDTINNSIKNHSRSGDVLYFDTQSVLSGYIPPAGRHNPALFQDTSHLTEEGHRRIARALYELIARHLSAGPHPGTAG